MTSNHDANQARFLLELGPYDEDDLRVLRFESVERISEPFELRVELASGAGDLDFDAVVGQPAMFELRGTEGPRWVHGVAASFEQGAETEHNFFYDVVIRPRVWLLSQRVNSRIFQDDDVPKIVSTVLEEHGLSKGEDFDFQLTGTHPKREYCVQYCESDLAFVSRLLEEEGIFYFFEGSAERTKIVMGDERGAHKMIEGDPELRLAPKSGMISDERSEQVFNLRFSQHVRPGAFAHTDYEFKKPTLELLAEQKAADAVDLEVFEYPGEYVDPEVGSALAQVRLEEQQSRRRDTRGQSNCMRFFPGGLFDLVEHSRDEFNTTYLVTEIRQKGATPQALGAEAATGDEALYSNHFEAIPATTPFRPERKTPRPRIEGTQPAVVTGPDGEEIYCDEFGRVKVKFFWDRAGKSNETSSCWIRCSQPWADKDWGFVVIPRIGQEVLIDFLNGDPDEPILIGRVFNADRMPGTLPADKSKMSMRSQSLGGSGGSNEITMDDTGGTERFYVHAQYNMDEVVEYDHTSSVGNSETTSVAVDRTETVGNNETINIGVDRTETVGSNETITIGADRTETVGSNETITIGSNRTESVGANESVSVGANRSHTIASADTLSIGGAQSVSVGSMSNETVAAVKTTSVGAAYALSVGAGMNVAVGGASMEEIGVTKQLTVGSEYSVTAKVIVLEGQEEISLKAGASSITLKSSGEIEISGVKINLKGSGLIDAKAAIIKLNS